MRFLTKLLLAYSLLLSAGITLVGIVTSRSTQTLLTPLLFVPVVLFLLLTAVKKSDFEAIEKRQKEFAVFALLFVVLLFFGVSSVYGSKKEAANKDTSLQSKPIIFSQEKKQVKPTPSLTVTLTKKTYLDIKSKPDDGSQSIAKVYDGEILVYVSKTDSWYEVVLSEDQSGFIKENNVKLNQ